MDSGIDVVVRWFAVIVAATLIAPYALAVFYRRVNEDAFGAVLRRMLEARELARAHKLATVESAPVLVATRAALALLLDGSILRRDATDDYRTAGATVDPETVKRRLAAAFVHALDEARRHRWVLRVVALVGALGLVFVIVEGLPRRAIEPLVVAGVLLVIFGATARRDRAERTAALAMLAKVDDALYACAMGAAPTSRADDARFVLIIDEQGSASYEVALTEIVTKIGRASSATITLASDDVARMHAIIEVDNDVATLVDLGSSKGTLVNGTAVNKHELRDGDRITIGPYTLTVRQRS
ncbi:MAG: FHA domain-containing protein [Myxococcales bacterium]|nr:FHA domain-containing protein [Myxococcales bacterium]